MPKFHYKVELADGTIAKRSSFREYTHLIEISPQSIRGYIADLNRLIDNERDNWESHNKTPEEIAVQMYDENVNDTNRISAWNWLSEEDKTRNILSAIDSNAKWYSVERYAEARDNIAERIKNIEDKRDKAIADGHPTVGEYFASNWCGSLALAQKKVNSADIRYYTDRGRTARIVPTFLGE